MAQPDIADFQVDLTDGLKGKIDLDDLKDVTAPSPGDGDVVMWNGTSNKWENAIFVIPAGDAGPGGVTAIGATSPPTGFLECNGATISRTTYADLFGVIGTTFGAGNGSTTFTLPDLRGEFIRGWDNGRGIDSGRSLGSFQSDSFGSHSHRGQSGNGNNSPLGGIVLGSLGFGGGTADDRWITYDTSSTGSADTRPRNRSLMYIIKY